MAHITEPRVGEVTTTAGTGPWTFTGALTSHRAFSAVCSTNDTMWVDVEGVDATTGVPTGEWCEGLGTYSGASQITMTTVYRSSNANLAVTFTAGTQVIRLIADARQLAGVPRGGSAGQAISKVDGTDYNTTWSTFLASGGALGTPSSGVATNLTGTASGLTAGNVTTNANLTGHVTSTGNAAVLGSFTAAQLSAAVNDDDPAYLGTAETFTKAQRGAFVTLTDAATVALDLSLANQYFVALGGSRTLGTPTSIVAGQQGIINIRQDATGSRTLAYAWPYEWAGGTAGVLSTAGCTRDMLAYSVDFYYTATVTITIAAPGVITATAHGMSTGQRFQLTNSGGALPTGLTASTTYFASVVDANSIKACTTLANAAAGTFITTTGSQSGTHTLVAASISLQLGKAFA